VRSGFPLDDVTVERSLVKKGVSVSLCRGETWQVNGNEFAMQVPGVGCFYARDGREVVYCIEPDADHDWVQLYLNGQVLVALLHQRKIINFHASSFIYAGRGVMVLGETGAGKSSLAVAFALAGAGFLTDDLTPVIFRQGRPCMQSLYRDVKIRDNTVSQLKIGQEKLRDAEAGTGKKYLTVRGAEVEDHPMNVIMKIETGEVNEPEFSEPSPAEKFSLLRSEVCMWEVLAGMPETEAAYLQQLLGIISQVHFVRVVRPAEIRIIDLRGAVEEYLGRYEGDKDKGNSRGFARES